MILTGLPGAGKTTLLRRLYGPDVERLPITAGTTVVIDSSQARRQWDDRLTWAPYRVRRVFIFATHVKHIRRALAGGHAVIAHQRGCGRHVLYWFAGLARLHGASLQLLLLDAPADEALAGQVARGRMVPARTFDRHRRRWESLLARVKNGDHAPAAGARVIDRAEACLLEAIVFDDSRAPAPPRAD
ncbi:AAA family ATPase [Nonomuraea terrae]|uniref:AAA family ATPase n=1 Tax=Nonomuraea terrae TaxID=2530383 RepID=UPI001FE2FAE4|nr:AAA family ATPase [Nonomuraea terrae]